MHHMVWLKIEIWSSYETIKINAPVKNQNWQNTINNFSDVIAGKRY